MKVFVVTHQIGGFAREDAPNTVVAGVFSEDEFSKAAKVSLAVNGVIHTVELNHISPGHLDYLEALGMSV